jgi:LPS export ABC transporter protein LptC
MKRLAFKRLVVVLALPLILAACNGQPPDRSTAGDADSASLPDSEVTGATIHLYEGGRITTRIVAERILKFEALDSTVAYVLRVDFLDSTGVKTSELVGDSGIIREDAGILKVFDHVVVTTTDDKMLETDYLQWNSATDKVESDRFVRFTRGDQVIRGYGLETDRGLSRVRIIRPVSGPMTIDE